MFSQDKLTFNTPFFSQSKMLLLVTVVGLAQASTLIRSDPIVMTLTNKTDQVCWCDQAHTLVCGTWYTLVFKVLNDSSNDGKSHCVWDACLNEFYTFLVYPLIIGEDYPICFYHWDDNVDHEWCGVPGSFYGRSSDDASSEEGLEWYYIILILAVAIGAFVGCPILLCWLAGIPTRRRRSLEKRAVPGFAGSI